jgi:hypothetical protein
MEYSKGCTDNRERGCKDQHWWYLTKKSTQCLFQKCGYKSTEDLSRIVCSLGIKERYAMFSAMMDADGDKRNNFGKGKIEIIKAFQILCALSGNLTSKTITREFEKGTQPFYLSRKLSYNKVAYQNLAEGEKRKTSVWCPTTKHGTWICRSDKGQVFVTGNTKAKRRVTLSICGLGFVDESEIETIPGAKKVAVDIETGEIPVECEEIFTKVADVCENPCDNSTQKPKITEKQLKEINELEEKVDANCKKAFKDYLLYHFQVIENANIPPHAYDGCVRSLISNINLNKQLQRVRNENT